MRNSVNALCSRCPSGCRSSSPTGATICRGFSTTGTATSHWPQAPMPDYMAACDALVLTSAQEGSPNAVKESLACDLPVVSVAVGDVAERLQGVAGCELCADDRPETIAAALGPVLERGGR